MSAGRLGDEAETQKSDVAKVCRKNGLSHHTFAT